MENNALQGSFWQIRAQRVLISDLRRVKIKGWVITPLGDFEPYVADFLLSVACMEGCDMPGFITWKNPSVWTEMVKKARLYAGQEKPTTPIEIIRYSITGNLHKEHNNYKSEGQWNQVFEGLILQEGDRQRLEEYITWVDLTFMRINPNKKQSSSLLEALGRINKLIPFVPTDFLSKKTENKKKKLENF